MSVGAAPSPDFPAPWRDISGVIGSRRVSPPTPPSTPTIMRESRELNESLVEKARVLLRLFRCWLTGVAATSSWKYFSCSMLEDASPPLDTPGKMMNITFVRFKLTSGDNKKITELSLLLCCVLLLI